MIYCASATLQIYSDVIGSEIDLLEVDVTNAVQSSDLSEQCNTHMRCARVCHSESVCGCVHERECALPCVNVCMRENARYRA